MLQFGVSLLAMLAKAMRLSYRHQLHIYSTGIIYDRHLRSSKYVYNTGHRSFSQPALTARGINEDP